MMELIKEWIISLSVFSLLSSLVIKLLPGKKYTPYVRLFSGIVMILLFLQPVLDLTGANEVLEVSFMEGAYDTEIARMEKELLKVEENQQKLNETVYCENVESQILTYAQKVSGSLSKCECVLKDGMPDEIILTGTSSLSFEESEKIKDYIETYYQVEPEKVTVKVEQENDKD